jgi:hypothetical protein
MSFAIKISVYSGCSLKVELGLESFVAVWEKQLSKRLEPIMIYNQRPPLETDQVARQQYSCHSVLM